MKEFTNKVLFTLIVLLFFITPKISFAQEYSKYWVFLADKDGVEFDPYTYFDNKAIERRVKLGIPLNDISDYPLKSSYVEEIGLLVDSIAQQSRWFNALAVFVDQNQLQKLSELDFVEKLQPIVMYPRLSEYTDAYTELAKKDVDFLRKQIGRMEGQLFHEKGIHGKGIRIAVFDAGFSKVNTHPAFEHMRKNNQIIKTWDFTKNKEKVYGAHSHGRMVLSCIGGRMGEHAIGLATDAEYLLARTEVSSEPFSEEENWLAAVEWADKNGAYIINSSLGYTYHRYFNDQMDGKTSLVARAANMAARKGILVVNSAGNSGSDSWYYVGTPADADSVLSVGGISPTSGLHINFSSYGPTSDNRPKPNVTAFGSALVAKRKGLGFAQGTSFSSPLVAGFAACAWQTDRSLSNMDLFESIEKSADLYPYFDYAHGYGVPQATYFLEKSEEAEPSFEFVITNDNLIVKIKEGALPKSSYDQNRLFYNIKKPDGSLKKYAVIAVYQSEVMNIKLTDLEPGSSINVFYQNYFQSFESN